MTSVHCGALRFALASGSILIACYSGSATNDDLGSSSTSAGTSVTAMTSVSTTMTTVDDASATMTTTVSTSMTTDATADTSSEGTTTASTGVVDSSGGSSSSSEGGETGPVVPPCPYDAVDAPSGYTFEEVAQGLESPLFALGHPTEPDRLFVLEQGGAIQMIEPGTVDPVDPPILEIPVLVGSERGLLGLAFHPDFPDDPRIYVDYTSNNDGSVVIAEYLLDPEQNWVADPLSERVITEIYHPNYNHNGGGIGFDDEGFLLIGMGDGAMSGVSRDVSVLLSKFLRIGVEPDGSMDDTPACNGCPGYGPFDYTIPPTNPFVGVAGYAEEIYAVGFRNPWRWSRDVATGEVWIGDVGDGAWEEVDLLVAGRDYGWVDMEGRHCHDQGDCDDEAAPHAINADGLTMPIIEVDHDPDCAIIGGAMYRSCQVPDWGGTYFYTDYCNDDVRALQWDGTDVEDLGVVIQPPSGFLGNGWNAWGDVYFTGGNVSGTVRRIVPVQ